jgi:protein involved in polysaccharide export with SLBB domain
VGDSLRINLATTSAAEVAAIQIPAGATVTVEESPGRSIRVIGVIADREVEVPAGRNVRLLDALALAGGPSYSNWISNRVDIIRRIPGKDETIRIRASIRKAKKDDKQNVLLAPNDIVSVEENLVTFTLSTLGGLSGLTNAARAATVP